MASPPGCFCFQLLSNRSGDHIHLPIATEGNDASNVEIWLDEQDTELTGETVSVVQTPAQQQLVSDRAAMRVNPVPEGSIESILTPGLLLPNVYQGIPQLGMTDFSQSVLSTNAS